VEWTDGMAASRPKLDDTNSGWKIKNLYKLRVKV
jgi:hypothetical protein